MTYSIITCCCCCLFIYYYYYYYYYVHFKLTASVHVRVRASMNDSRSNVSALSVFVSKFVNFLISINSFRFKCWYCGQNNILHFFQYHSRRCITCKRGSAAVVRTTCCSYGEPQILNLSRAETTEPINTKFWTIDYLGEIKRIAKFGCNGFSGSVSPSGWNIH